MAGMTTSQYTKMLRAIAMQLIEQGHVPRGCVTTAEICAKEILDHVVAVMDPCCSVHALELNRQNQALRAQLMEAGLDPRTLS